jgi:hypothetical protein
MTWVLLPPEVLAQRQATLKSRRSGKRVPSPSPPRRSSARRPTGARMNARLQHQSVASRHFILRIRAGTHPQCATKAALVSAFVTMVLCPCPWGIPLAPTHIRVSRARRPTATIPPRPSVSALHTFVPSNPTPLSNQSFERQAAISPPPTTTLPTIDDCPQERHRHVYW